MANERNVGPGTDADPVLTETEAATYVKTTPRKLRRLRSEGKIRYSRVGLTPTYRRSYLDEYLKQLWQQSALRLREIERELQP